MVEQTDMFFGDDDDPSDENLADLHVGQRSLASSVVYNTDWTVETITRKVEKSAIDLTPNFQRRDAWTPAKKSLLIESVLLNFPVPPLTLAELGSTKTYVVVDGKQRLTTLSQFFGLMPGSRYNKFKLTGLVELSNLNGLDIGQLSQNHPSLLRAIENYTICTNVIRGWHNDDVLYSIFLRLNSASVKLSPQELRQALNPGPFSTWLAEYTATSETMLEIFGGVEPDFRMRDMELMIRYLSMQFFLTDYRGDLKRFLDTAARAFNSDWDYWQHRIEQKAVQFEESYRTLMIIFGRDRIFRKWTGDKWENRLNRAVFDVMTYYLTSASILVETTKTGEALVSDFKDLCNSDERFKDAIETTTKSIDAVATRLGRWGEKLAAHGIVTNVVGVSADRTLILDAPIH